MAMSRNSVNKMGGDGIIKKRHNTLSKIYNIKIYNPNKR